MAIICEECGKIYHIDKEKLKEQIVGESVKTKCRICGFVMEITRESLENDDAVKELFFHGTESDFSGEFDPVAEISEESPEDDEIDDKQEINSVSEKKNTERKKKKDGRKGFGLRTKMFFLFLLIPILLMAASGFFSQYQLKRLSQDITRKGTGVVKDFAERRIAEKATDVALQCQIYLSSHPEINKEEFNYTDEFKKIAVQKIGNTGYTLLMEKALQTEPMESSRIWAHPDPSIIGVAALGKIKKELGKDFDNFIETLRPLLRGEEVTGYYKWVDVNGKLVEKFLTAVHIKGTRYAIIATAPIDEFTKPIRELEDDAKMLTNQTRNINIIILIVTLVIISAAILIYGYRITKNIKYLTDTADRISVGELDVEIEVDARDEIGNLADAISRMQDSLRLSIERLRKRK